MDDSDGRHRELTADASMNESQKNMNESYGVAMPYWLLHISEDVWLISLGVFCLSP